MTSRNRSQSGSGGFWFRSTFCGSAPVPQSSESFGWRHRGICLRRVEAAHRPVLRPAEVWKDWRLITRTEQRKPNKLVMILFSQEFFWKSFCHKNTIGHDGFRSRINWFKKKKKPQINKLSYTRIKINLRLKWRTYRTCTVSWSVTTFGPLTKGFEC